MKKLDTTKRMNELSQIVKDKKSIIVEAKASIELSIKEALNIVLSDIKSLKGENSLINKKDALKVIKERYINITTDKDIKDINLKVCDYIYLGINIKLEEVTNNQFKKIVTFFNKLSVLPTKKDGGKNEHYIKGLENVVNKTKLNNCTTQKMYVEYIREIEDYIEKVKNS